MAHPVEALTAAVNERLGSKLTATSTYRGQRTVECAPEDLIEVCTVLRDHPAMRFEQLVDLCGIDYLDYGRSDWQSSETATGTGFSRGVQEESGGEHIEEFVRARAGSATLLEQQRWTPESHACDGFYLAALTRAR